MIILTIPDSLQSDCVVAFINASVMGSVVNDGHVGQDGQVTAKIRQLLSCNIDSF